MGRSFNASGGIQAFDGAEILGAFSCAELTGNTNDFTQQGVGFLRASVLLLSAAGAYNLTGLQGSSPNREILLLNVGTQNITLPANSGASQAKNQFYFSANSVLVPNQAVRLIGLPGGGWGPIGSAPSAGGSPAPSGLTYVTTTNETATLPDSVVLGSGTFSGAFVTAEYTFYGPGNFLPVTMNDPPVYDTGLAVSGAAYWNASTPTRLTAPVAGFYMASTSLYWDESGQAQYGVMFCKNGTHAKAGAYGFSSMTASGGGNPWPGTALSVPLQLAAGDYLEVCVFVGGGSSNLASSTQAGPDQSFFSLTQLK